MSAEPVGSLGKIYIDVGDLTQAARFWGGLLGLEPRQPRSDPMGGRFVDVGAKLGTTMIVLQQVPEPHTVKNRLHLDINVSNLETAIQGVITLGDRRFAIWRVALRSWLTLTEMSSA